MNEIELLRAYATCWNTLDVSGIAPLLSEDVEYTSQWVLTPIQGKNAVLEYLHQKFHTLRDALSDYSVKAHIGFFPTIQRHGLILIQGSPKGNIKVTVLVETTGDLIQKIHLCEIPDPEEAIMMDGPLG